MENTWKRRGADYFLEEVGDNVRPLPIAVYMLQAVPVIGTLYLTQIEDEFELPRKVYGVETHFINRVIKTYNFTTGNLGVLMNGIRGTGKTVTAKQISNQMKMPVIIIKDNFDNTADFLNSLQDDVILFFDEYEKIYDDYNSDILTVMDGVLTTKYRKLFLLTTNNAYVNENMLQRPGRIRYFKTFTDLTLETIIEIVDDRLINKEFKDEVVKFLANLEIITIDIVCAVIEEVNIHDELPEKFKGVFNVKPLDDVFDVSILKDGKRQLLYSRVTVDPMRPTKACIGKVFRIDGTIVGRITESIKDEGFKVQSAGIMPLLDIEERVDKEVGGGTTDQEYELLNADGDKKMITTTYILERTTGLHKVFSSYAF